MQIQRYQLGIPVLINSLPICKWYVTLFLHTPLLYQWIQRLNLFRYCVLTSTSLEPLYALIITICLSLICVHYTDLLLNFGQWHICISVLACNLTFVYYHTLQLCQVIFNYSFICFVWCLYYLFGNRNWQWNWYFLW